LTAVLAVLLAVSTGYSAGEGKQGQTGKDTQAQFSGPKFLADHMIGKDVTNPQNEDLGNISDIVIDRDTGYSSLVLMETDTGFLGMGDKVVAIPYKALKPSQTGESLVLNIDKERLEKAPAFDKDQINQLDRGKETEVYRFYGVSPYWE
jgi:sporulation protein YlmC with PRC-barrel domain